jgi:hypothetical protein
MYFARCNLLWICWCQLSCQRFKIYFIIKGFKSVKGIEQLTGEGSGGRCRPSAGTRQSPGRVPGGSEVLAFYKQYNQRKKLIKMQENLYILFDAVLRFTNFKVCYLLNVTFWWEYNALQFHSSRLYWRLNQVYARGFFWGGGLRGGCTSTQSTPWLRPCIRSSNVLQYLTLTWTTSYFDILYCK